MAKKILFINQEIAPYVPETEMSVLGRDLPAKTQEAGFEIRTFMPKWGNINERRGQLHEVIRLSGMNIVINDTDHPILIKVASIPVTRVQVYFIDNDDYFSRRQMAEDEQGEEYADNGERAIFFARGVLETVKKLRWAPDVIVCQGWMAGVVPFYIKEAYRNEPAYAETKVVTSLFAKQLRGDLGNSFKKNIPFGKLKASLLKSYPNTFDFNELAHLAIDYSDGIIEAGKDVNQDLLAYARDKKLPILPYPGDDYQQAYADFFNNL